MTQKHYNHRVPGYVNLLYISKAKKKKKEKENVIGNIDTSDDKKIKSVLQNKALTF